MDNTDTQKMGMKQTPIDMRAHDTNAATNPLIPPIATGLTTPIRLPTQQRMRGCSWNPLQGGCQLP